MTQQEILNAQFPISELYQTVQRCFPSGIIEYIYNWDDVNTVINVAIKPFTSLQVIVPMAGGLNISICKFTNGPFADLNKNPGTIIFNGPIPAADDGPDFDFIEKVIRNYDRFK